MINRQIVACAVAGILLFSTSCQPSKEQYRKDFVKGCVNSYAKDSSVASVTGRKLVEEYCNCVGDILNKNMSAEQWRAFNKKNDTTMGIFRDSIQPCLTSFRQQLANSVNME